jgi:hypothetical protein
MIYIPPDKFIEGTLRIGTVYKFEAPELIETNVPHYFVVVAIDEEEIHMVKGTSQKETKQNYFERMGLDFGGLVCIKPDSRNGFKLDTYFDCNDNFPVTKEDLIKKANNGLSCEGIISYNHYDQLRIGIKNSHKNDLPKDLLVHPED